MSEFNLELQRVSKHFGDVRAVADITLRVRTGEFLSLLGPSGCGKTTCLRLVAGFETPTSGEIRLDGRSLANTPPYRRNVNTVFQHYALFPHKTVFDNVAFGLRMKRLPALDVSRRVGQMLELVELPGVGQRFPHQLSGGQQQRIALARALINEPTVLLLDEPLGALDLKVRRRMQGELKRIHREIGITFIYVTHDQEEALTMSDRIAVMARGRVEQLGTPAAIYERPATRFVAHFIGLTNVFRGTVIECQEGETVIRTDRGVTIRAAASAGVRVGDPVELVVRPERIQFSEGRRVAADNCLDGSVADVVYQGVATEYQVRDDAGHDVRVVVQNQDDSRDGARFPVGSRVSLCWSKWSALVLPDAPAAAGPEVAGDETTAVSVARAG
jgi:spermidine/putrescine transport system ATP-binding protein